MRIEVLEKREDFIKIARQTLQYSTFLNSKNHVVEKKYYLNKYLNFIASESLPKKTFQILVNEYSTSLDWEKKVIQYIYVRLSISKFFRKIFSHGTVLLPSIFSNYLILGGNHRLRLFSKELNSTFVLLKFNERYNYITNDLTLRSKFKLDYAPKIINYGDDWLEEEYFEGTPINRLIDDKLIKSTLRKVILNHDKLLVSKSIKSMKKDDFFQYVQKDVNLILKHENKYSDKIKLDLIRQTFKQLFSKVLRKNISISWTHGDFHQANILIKDSSYRVIDWESSQRRFYLYDLFILTSGLRRGVSIQEGIKNFEREVGEFIDRKLIDSDSIILLLIEELRFNINETFSVNYYESGSNTTNLCNSIQVYLDEFYD